MTAILSGTEQALELLRQIPITVREQVLKRAVNNAVGIATDDMARNAPAPGRAVGGIKYGTRRGRRRGRPQLALSIGQRQKLYQAGQVIVGIGGPVKAKVGRHAHLVERGFNHTKGGTLEGSGGRRARRAKSAERTGKGVVTRRVPARPFVGPAFERTRNAMLAELEASLRRYLERMRG